MKKERLHNYLNNFAQKKMPNHAIYLLTISIFAILAGILFSGPLYSEEALMRSGNRSRAVNIAEEGLEAVRNIRDSNYALLAPGSYGLSKDSGSWTLSGSSDTVGIFTRQIQINEISANTSEIISTVSWQWKDSDRNTLSLTTYLTRWK